MLLRPIAPSKTLSNASTHARSGSFLMLAISALAWLGSVAPVISAPPQDAQQGPVTVDSARPNILWITSEDNGPEVGCYGDAFADTPNIDSIAARGMRYTRCWSNAPVCAPARTTILSGMFPTSFGGQHMRSQVKLPAMAKPYPEVFRQMGYYCTNHAKEDYNLHLDKDLWNESSPKAHWRKRGPGQPFFSVFNYTISHESKLRTRPHKAIHSAAEVTVPPYHPDTPEVRQDWAQYYDRVTEMDVRVGEILQQLRDDGLEEDTIIFYYGDHGGGMPRGKRWLYQSGLHVPMIVHVPGKFQYLVKGQYVAGTVSDRLISFVDLMPTVLSLASSKPPEHLHGKAFLGPFATDDPTYIYGFRDRMDERYDMSRAVRDERFMYIRNFMPQRPQGAYLDYMFQTPTTRIWKDMFDAGKLNVAQSFFWLPKPSEELYDIQSDPYQVTNLVDSQSHSAILDRMRAETKSWMVRTGDVGFMPEGLMLSRAGGDSPYRVGHDAESYPLESIYDFADLATRPTAGDLKTLVKHVDASDPVLRYWVASGLLIRAMRDTDRSAAIQQAIGLMQDTSPYVRSLACETVARFGTPADRQKAVANLLKMTNPQDTGTFPAMAAMNSIDFCELSQAELGSVLDGVTEPEPKSSRYKSYIPNLVKRLSSTTEKR